MRGPREMPRKRCGSQRCVGPEGHKPSQTPRREMRARVAHFLVLPPFHPKYILWFAKYYGLIPVVSRALHKAPLCSGWTGTARPIPCTKAARHHRHKPCTLSIPRIHFAILFLPCGPISPDLSLSPFFSPLTRQRCNPRRMDRADKAKKFQTKSAEK